MEAACPICPCAICEFRLSAISGNGCDLCFRDLRNRSSYASSEVVFIALVGAMVSVMFKCFGSPTMLGSRFGMRSTS